MRRLNFFLERWIQRGVLHQLLLMAAFIGLVALLGGLFAWGSTDGFAGPAEAVWWAFLRLTDPGYLGDDQGLVLRVVSTVITVLGYVIFMGSLIAIMTQWLARTLRKLESGLTPIRMSGHVIILGWTNRTSDVVLRLLSARGRLKRYLALKGVSKLRIVVLSEEVSAERRLELREYLGGFWDERRVFLRSGSSLQPEHLKRLDLARAATVIIPGADFELGGAEASDTRVIKTLLTVNNVVRQEPHASAPALVAEVFDPQKISLARMSADGPVDVIGSDALISRLISQSIRHRGLARVLFMLLSHRQTSSIYLRGFPELAGHRPRDFFDSFPSAVVLGYVRTDGATRSTNLDPLTDDVLRKDDLVVLLSQSYDHCTFSGQPPSPLEISPRSARSAPTAGKTNCRILILGWSHKLGALGVELDEARSGDFELVVMSRIDVEERERWLKRVELSDRVRIRHVRGDYSLESDLLALRPETFDNVVLLASDWMPSSREADARTILGYVLLRSLLEDSEAAPEILVELVDPDNSKLFGEAEDVYLVSPRVLSFLLGHIALRPELSAVFDEVLGAGGSEIDIRSVREFELSGKSVSFRDIQRTVLDHGVLALGVSTRTDGIELNPDRTKRWTFADSDDLVVLSVSDRGAGA